METAMLFIALVSGIMQGVQTWFAVKDRAAARQAQKRAYIQTLRAPETRIRAEHLMAIVPIKTMDLLRRRVQSCYDRFDEILENDREYFPQDISDAAEKALRSE